MFTLAFPPVSTGKNSIVKKENTMNLLMTKPSEYFPKKMEVETKNNTEKEKKEIKEEKQWVTVRLSYYTDNSHCTGQNNGLTKSEKKPKNGMIAAPKEFPFGTKFVLEDGTSYVVEDRGSAIRIKDGVIWLDVFVENATNQELCDLGIKYAKAYIINN